MAFTHTFLRGWSSSTGGSLSKSVSASGGLEVSVQETIPISTSDKLLTDVKFTIAQLKGLYIVANQPLKLEFNSSSAPVNTINLIADVPFAWVFGDPTLTDNNGTPAAFVDVTAVYVTNASITNTSDLEIRILTDPTV